MQLVVHPPRAQKPEEKKFMIEGSKRSSEFSKWFLTTNNLLEDKSSYEIFDE